MSGGTFQVRDKHLDHWMTGHAVTIRSAKSSTWLLFGAAATFFAFGVYVLAFFPSPEFAILPFLGVVGLLLVWMKYHRGNPAWIVIDEDGLRSPMIFPGLIHWYQVQDIIPYTGFRGDHGIRVKFNRYLKADGAEANAPTLTHDADEHTNWVKVSLINCDLKCWPPQLAEALNRIRSQEGSKRLGALEQLQAIV